MIIIIKITNGALLNILTLLSQEVAAKKLAFGLNFIQLIVSDGGCCTSTSLAVVMDEPKLNEPVPPNNDIFFASKTLPLLMTN